MRAHHLAATLFALSLCPIFLPAQAAGSAHPVQFAKGASSATLKGSIKGEDYADYKLRTGAGQTMTVSMKADSSSAYFNVLPPGSKDVALYNSSIEGNQWSGQLQTAGEYTIRVYLYRNEARRGTTAHYSLTVGITGVSSSSSIDAKVAGTPFNAIGELRCALGSAAPTMCPFGVIRGQPGHAEVRITPPGGMERSLKFSGDQVTAPSSRSIKASKQGDEWSIEVNDFERYRIPEAVVNGG